MDSLTDCARLSVPILLWIRLRGSIDEVVKRYLRFEKQLSEQRANVNRVVGNCFALKKAIQKRLAEYGCFVVLHNRCLSAALSGGEICEGRVRNIAKPFSTSVSRNRYVLWETLEMRERVCERETTALG